MERRRAKSNSITSAPVPVGQPALFGPPLLLDGEVPEAYDALLSKIRMAVKPVDIIEELYVNEFVVLQWEVLRYRRLKSSLIRSYGLEALEDFLCPEIDLHAEGLLKTLRENLREHTEAIAKLAEKWGGGERDVDADKAEKLSQAYGRHEPWAVEQVGELLETAGRTMEDFTAKALVKELNSIERIDRLTTNAEIRRDASLHEIERRRAMLGQALRRSVQEVEDAEFKVLEPTPAKRKSAA